MSDKNPENFIHQIIKEDIEKNRYNGKVLSRFPPEPNGFLHIGHATSICLNFGIAEKFGGKTNLRFDDTNPTTEKSDYVNSIIEDISWLGFDCKERIFFASDYFDQLYEFAIQLIKTGKAYVDDSSSEEIALMKGTLTESGTNSPYRERTVEENLDLFEKMRDGVFEVGSKTLRAKIDMSHTNLLMRDPILYRIKKEPHHRTGDKWNIYPTYDMAHGQSDAIEKITHSICTLEFKNHRPLYDWLIKSLQIFPSRQIEFARRNLSHTIVSKRKLLKLVNEKHVSGWDDPRMPTIAGLRRRGYTAQAIRRWANEIGIGKRENVVDITNLEFYVREDLNKKSIRVMGVLEPVKLVITNYPEDAEEFIDLENSPEDESLGTRQINFDREIYIEREDFRIDPPKKFFRLSPQGYVRLKGAYIVQCQDYLLDENGKVKEIRCIYFPDSRSGSDRSGIKIKSTIHWVSISTALKVEVRLYDRLFTDPKPDGEDKNYLDYLNPNSLEVLKEVYVEPGLKDAELGIPYQFIRKGYFCLDPDSSKEHLIFNRTVELRDTWKKKHKQHPSIAK